MKRIEMDMKETLGRMLGRVESTFSEAHETHLDGRFKQLNTCVISSSKNSYLKLTLVLLYHMCISTYRTLNNEKSIKKIFLVSMTRHPQLFV
jgi:hypothetical protein